MIITTHTQEAMATSEAIALAIKSLEHVAKLKIGDDDRIAAAIRILQSLDTHSAFEDELHA